MAARQRVGAEECWRHPALAVHGVDLSNAARADGAGAYMRAVDCVAANTCLLREMPYAAVLLDQRATTDEYCHHCFARLEAHPCPCEDCYAAFYCNPACAEAASAGHRGGECASLRRLQGNFEGTRDARLLCRIQHTKRVQCCWPAQGQSDPGASLPAADQLQALVYHPLEEGSDSANDAWVAAAVGSIQVANAILPAALALSMDAGMAMLLRIRANAISLLDPDGAPLGIGVWPLASYFNHSCRPNACIDNCGRQIRIVAIDGIAAGVEVTIAYVDGCCPRRARREKLLRVYGFECSCARCLEQASSELGCHGLCRATATAEQRRHADALYAEWGACVEEGRVSRGAGLLRTLAGLEHARPSVRAWATHVLECHGESLQCSAGP
jgi:hypothetical protein